MKLFWNIVKLILKIENLLQYSVYTYVYLTFSYFSFRSITITEWVDRKLESL